MSTDARADHESIADRSPGDYQYHGERSRPAWTHTETGLLVQLVREQSVPEGRMDKAAARTPDDLVWRLEVRPDGPGTYAEVYRRLSGSRRGAVETALQWLDDHRTGQYDA